MRTSLILKLVALGLFLALSILVVACGAASQADPGNPPVTVTINLGQVNGSPTPKLPDYACGGWATNTSPPFNPSSIVEVFAKFTHNVGGNPEGVNNASATATILWPDGGQDVQTVRTTSDGLAVFPVIMKASALNHIVLIQISFTSPDGITCSIPQAAYFTAIMVSPTASPTSTNGNGTPSPTVSPTGSPFPGPGTPLPSLTPRPPKRTPTPPH